MLTARPWGFASSTGQDFTHATIVDAHFLACRPEYEDLVRQAGIRRGWRVLDAGCGSGSFLPLLADLVGATGRVFGIDLADEHVTLATQRIHRLAPPCPVEVVAGDLAALPHPDASLDAVWCANTVQYLADDELARVLAECRRVLRPGGVVAVKDLDASLITVRPGDPFLFTDFFRAAADRPGYARQLLRTRELHRWFAAAGFAGVRQRTVLIEHFAPFTAAAKQFYGESCAAIARQATAAGAGGEWDRFLDPDDPRNPLGDSHGYVCEGNVLVTGTVGPAAGS